MFRERDSQTSFLDDASLFLPEEKVARLQLTWAEAFRTQALPLIDERPFAEMYCADNGRPNRPVQVVLGVLFLKEMFNLTDRDALEQLEWNLTWQYALALRPEEAHLAQKTLHNFRAKLMEHDLARIAFQQITDRIISALEVSTNRQRLDSTHIISNIATLTRLGLFCETIRVFIRSLQRAEPELYERIPRGLAGRYFQEGEPSAYEDVPSSKARRKLPVCARDLYRLVDMFRGTAAAELEEYELIERLLTEQCEIDAQAEPPGDDDDDAGDGGAPVQLKDPKRIRSDSLQSPHDPDATYSGHKGKGYEVQVTETTSEENRVEIITDVEVTDSSDSDANYTVHAVEKLKERGHLPEELLLDTTYSSAEISLDAQRLGTKIIGPVAGTTDSGEEAIPDDADEEPPLTAADFEIDPTGEEPTKCPAGHEATTEFEHKDENSAVAFFGEHTCETCPLRSRCPVKLHSEEGAGYFVILDLKAADRERRRREQATPEFHELYRRRAGIEATNSELKRKHGLGNIRIRGRPRVELVVYLKAAACNIKRMLAHLTGKARREIALAAC